MSGWRGSTCTKTWLKVAIRSPGEKPWTRKTEILEYRTFYGVLQEMARELRRRGVTHVVMEASGVYTEPVYYALCEQDFTQVAVINPAHAKALRGHKTDLLTELGGEVPQVSGRMGVLVATDAHPGPLPFTSGRPWPDATSGASGPGSTTVAAVRPGGDLGAGAGTRADRSAR